MGDEDEIVEAVDNLVEGLEGSAASEAKRLGLDSDELLDRVANEIKARLGMTG